MQSDETPIQISCFITGSKEMNITYHILFFEKNEAIIQAVLKSRLRTSFGGPDESEASE